MVLSLFWHRYRRVRILMLVMGSLLAGCFLVSHSGSQPLPPRAGGETTVWNRTSTAYEQPAPNLSPGWARLHAMGDITFEARFVAAPAPVNPGLGPVFNNNSCAGCHLKNGRGLAEKGQRVVRVSQLQSLEERDPVPSPWGWEVMAPNSNTPPVPGIGTQVQEKAIRGYRPEAKVELTWRELKGHYGDGTTYSLRFPEVNLYTLESQSIDNVLLSLRIPQPVFGVGLLEAIPEAELLHQADPEDVNQDGISGRPNFVWDAVHQKISLGRFGWKANTPNLEQQTAAAYVNDMGVTNPLFPAADGSHDIDEATLRATTVYVQTLAVPARTLWRDPTVQQGEKLFAQAQCTACHLPQLRTGSHEIAALQNQIIHPYTDLLLHDMGEELADHRPDFAATGKEWRTPPLWGIGLSQTVLPYSGYLHDGRARNLEEAILWHGGEAERSREAFRNMTAEEREALIYFLRSL
ncbi:di-heme oxidoredictase family protein [Thermostichus vulcanus]|uniref:C-type cytochrome n=1 Tax=Thermostichus vulcanus str. 'Rupite' TaxID=2813851 RepID=A0ABT0CFH5_THEVL|nr:di-heme oxidoredictase family protein [Thermostichus vulcanus]MCJ2544516.1 c-type cytochrome [Thermostichus vulcanus str. 'Rupite']